MLFVTDQHHLNDLEMTVIKDKGRKRTIRLLGDISPSQENIGTNEIEEGSSLLKKIQISYKERNGINKYQELSFDQKKEAHESGIMASNKDIFTEFIAYYGGAPIFNLARKYFIHSFSEKPVICLSGNEKLMEHAQEIVYQRIKEEQKIKNHEVMGYVLNFLEEKKEKTYNIIKNQLDLCGITNTKSFITDSLKVSNYGNQVPTSLSTFKGHPKLKKFIFKDELYWENIAENALIYIPYLNDDSERNAAAFRINDLRKFLNLSERKYISIGSHGNPFPRKMKEKKLHKRTDHNLGVIESIINTVIDIKGDKQGINIFCGHLHKSNEPYNWDGKTNITIYPIGTKEILYLDPEKDDIKKEKF
ncbi:hypothetical protein GF336_02740 [Candidatus Woesearchaeota archaeon]|nr:hypothetical protein [Candidatus Woesearchaeota archaeon]